MKFDKKVKLEIQLVVVFLISSGLLVYFIMRRDGGDAFAIAACFIFSILSAKALYDTIKQKTK